MVEGRNEIVVKLQGAKITEEGVEAYSLGNFLLDFQSTVARISQMSVGKSKNTKEITKMYLKSITKGSAILSFGSGIHDTIDHETDLKMAYDDLKRIFQVMDKSPEEGRKELIENHKDTVSRLKLELSLMNIVKSPFEITLYDATDTGVKVNKTWLKYVSGWIDEDQKETPQSIKGVIIRIKGDKPDRTFTILDENGKLVKCDLNQELEIDVLSKFKLPVEIQGILKKNLKTPKVIEVKGLVPLNSFRTNDIASLRLTKTVEINVEYDDEIWCLSIPQLNANGCGYSLNKALEDLRESILGGYEIYVKDLKEDELSEKALELRRNLLSLLGDNNYENVQEERDN